MKKWSLALSCIVLATSLTAACGYNRTAAPQPTAPARTHTTSFTAPGTNVGPAGMNAYGTTTPNMYGATTPYPYGTTGQYPYGTTSQHMTGTTGHAHATFDHQLSAKAAKAANSVPGVHGAVAVVSGNDAVVGINMRGDATHTRQRHAIEQQAHSAVKAALPNHRVRITSDAAMVSRIRALDDGIRNQYGHPTGNRSIMGGPTTVTGNVRNMGTDFTNLLRDMGRTVTAPFR